MIEPLISLLRQLLLRSDSKEVNPEFCKRLGPIFKILYMLCKTRGYKTIVKFFSHEVTDLEPILEFTEAFTYSNMANADYWETPFVLLLWLSLDCMIPFDLTTIDTKHDLDQKEVFLKNSYQ